MPALRVLRRTSEKPGMVRYEVVSDGALLLGLDVAEDADADDLPAFLMALARRRGAHTGAPRRHLRAI